MSKEQAIIGNPVDAWWNHIRQEINFCIGLLGEYPIANDEFNTNDVFYKTQYALQAVIEVNFPPQAEHIRAYLIESLCFLIQSLKEHATQEKTSSENSHNMAYNKYLMVTYFLLQRGIYEPEPRLLRDQAHR